jgi:exonuclease SbcD
MKIAHLSDIHYSPKHLNWVDRAMAAAVDAAIDEAADAAVISGDSFDHGMGVHEPAFTAFIRQIIRLSNAMPVLILQGTFSHDRPGSLDVLKEIPTLHPVLVADRAAAYQLAPTVHEYQWIETESDGGIVDNAVGVFCCLPSLNKAEAAIMDCGAQAYVQTVMDRFRAITDQARTAALPAILVTHGTINGCRTESKYAMVSPDHEFTEATLLSSGANATLIGHIHATQEWRDNGQVIAYPGSLARLVHGDHDPKGWLLWEITADAADYQFVNSPTRQLFEIDFDGPPNMDELVNVATQASADDAVRIRWIVDQEYAHTIDKAAMRSLFSHCDSVKLEGTVLPMQSIRAEGISRAATLEDKLGYWLKTTGDEHQAGELSDRLQMLQSLDVDQIIDRLTQTDDESTKQQQEAA